MTLYKYVLHHPRNVLPKAYLETIGVYVSLLNGCEYCVEPHFAGLSHLLQNDERAGSIRSALENGSPETAIEGTDLEGLSYAAKLKAAAGDSKDPENWFTGGG